MNSHEDKLAQGVKRWNFIFTLFFILVTAFFVTTLSSHGNLPQSISVFNFIILSLSTFRLIRLFVYDNIFLFLREGLMAKKISLVDKEQRVQFVQSNSALLRTLHRLALCPWCMGVWVSLCSLFVLYEYPNSYILFVILAIAGVASLIQLLSNNVGWNAEYRKLQVERVEESKQG